MCSTIWTILISFFSFSLIFLCLNYWLCVCFRYKESISKSTRGWKERFFSRNTSMADIGSEVRREVNAGIATVSRMMEHLETKDNNRSGDASGSNSSGNSSVSELNNQQIPQVDGSNALNETSVQASCTATSGSN